MAMVRLSTKMLKATYALQVKTVVGMQSVSAHARNLIVGAHVTRSGPTALNVRGASTLGLNVA